MKKGGIDPAALAAATLAGAISLTGPEGPYQPPSMDTSVKSMIKNGHEELQPLFVFRNWLTVVRDQPEFRCKVRRNGSVGLGPITLDGRKLILQRLLQTEKKSGLKLLEDDELVRIKALWLVDKSDLSYREN